MKTNPKNFSNAVSFDNKNFFTMNLLLIDWPCSLMIDEIEATLQGKIITK